MPQATGDASFRRAVRARAGDSLRTYAAFLPGHPDRAQGDGPAARVLLFPRRAAAARPRPALLRCHATTGIRAWRLLREIAPEFERSDVYAQLLRMRVYADRAGVAPLDREAADFEAARLQTLRSARAAASISDARAATGCPYLNPVSTAFAMQALAVWSGEPASIADLI